MAQRKGFMYWVRIMVRTFMVAWLIAGSLLYAVVIQSPLQAVVTFCITIALLSSMIYGSDFFIKRRRTAGDVVRDRVSFDVAYGPDLIRP